MYYQRLLWSFTALLVGSCSQHPLQGRACTPPLSTWPQPHPHLGPDIPLVKIGLDRNGTVYFNGKMSTLQQLPAQLRIVEQMGAPSPAVILETEMGAPCDTLDQIRSTMNDVLKCDKGAHCDEGIQTVWRDLPSTDGPII